MSTKTSSAKLAIHGGPKLDIPEAGDMFHWPIVTREDEEAVIAVLREGSMSGNHISKQFEAEWGQYLGARFNLSFPNGTMSLEAAMYGVGIRRGDEVIVPSMTYWASGLQLLRMGATPVFADCEPDSLCLDPLDLEKRITERTRAIVVVHYCGHPADMDAIMAIARKHNLKVIEDLSHAQGALYKGRMCGVLGDVAGISMMGGKSFAIGEGGMLSTNDRLIYERAIAFAFYERQPSEITDPELRAQTVPDHVGTGMPLGGVKGRLNQTCAAMGRVQLKYYPQRIAEIQRAMNRFWDLLKGVPGIRAHRPPADSGSTMGGWYNPLGHYLPEELGGLPVEKFTEAVAAEGVKLGRSSNFPIHLHPVVQTADIYGDGKPTRVAFAQRDVREKPGDLPVSENLAKRCFGIPWFKHDWPEYIEACAACLRKVAENYRELL